MWQDSRYLCIVKLPLLNPWNPRTNHDISNSVEKTVAFRVVGAANTELLYYSIFLVSHVERTLRKLATKMFTLSLLFIYHH